MASAGLRYSKPLLASAPLPLNWLEEPLKKSCRDLRVSGSSVLKSWSRSTWVVVELAGRVPPAGISCADEPGGKARSTYRLAMPDCENWRMRAWVPTRSGALSSCTDISTSA